MTKHYSKRKKTVHSESKRRSHVATKLTKFKQTILLETEYFLFEKKYVLVSFEPMTFAVRGVIFTCWLRVQDKLKKVNAY